MSITYHSEDTMTTERTYYVVTTSQPGCLPEGDPHIFETDTNADTICAQLAPALAYLYDEVESIADGDGEDEAGKWDEVLADIYRDLYTCRTNTPDPLRGQVTFTHSTYAIAYSLPNGYTIQAVPHTREQLIANGWRPGEDFADDGGPTIEQIASDLAIADGYNPNDVPVGEWSAKRDEYLKRAE